MTWSGGDSNPPLGSWRAGGSPNAEGTDSLLSSVSPFDKVSRRKATTGKGARQLAKTQSIQTKIPVVFFEEGDKFVAYSPAFDLSSCGEILEEAKKRFAEAAAMFLREVSEMGTLDEVLAECG